jgi:hypothetical protein
MENCFIIVLILLLGKRGLSTDLPLFFWHYKIKALSLWYNKKRKQVDLLFTLKKK